MAATASIRPTLYGSSGPNGVAMTFAILGFLCGLIGTIMMYVAAHRALVKIDALQVQAPAETPAPAVGASSE
ncbi:hypothetical protein StoSoilB20_39100 [Arthrobacter sp. StoSoilB20]|nr:hypothetical protein StoSoilB20_39100 [Arthrobacter sp. StoSoilB20]